MTHGSLTASDTQFEPDFDSTGLAPSSVQVSVAKSYVACPMWYSPDPFCPLNMANRSVGGVSGRTNEPLPPDCARSRRRMTDTGLGQDPAVIERRVLHHEVPGGRVLRGVEPQLDGGRVEDRAKRHDVAR